MISLKKTAIYWPIRKIPKPAVPPRIPDANSISMLLIFGNPKIRPTIPMMIIYMANEFSPPCVSLSSNNTPLAIAQIAPAIAPVMTNLEKPF